MNEEIKALLKKAEESIKGARILFDDELYGFAVSRNNARYEMMLKKTQVEHRRFLVSAFICVHLRLIFSLFFIRPGRKNSQHNIHLGVIICEKVI
jgi:hypothetical protein